MAAKKEEASVPVYQLKVTIDGIEPPIWRRIQVRGDVTLFKLHKIIQEAMGWGDYHLHQFMVGREHYSDPSHEDPWDSDVKSEKRARLSKVAPDENNRFIYEYDFGDSWYHEILVEKIFVPDEELKRPVCLDGERSAPPEDCGGIPGYEDFLVAFRDPEHPDHEEIMDWAGEDYDPDKFDKNEINRLLKKIR
ncbi:MAG: plasmid pRiA4b ORF-3 family protein [Methanosarcinales archaeon]|nr:plasmid pRiA4b ORF-3 family protein [Methanosarcinales archaeon]